MSTGFIDAFHGLTANERQTVEQTARVLVSSGARDELLRQLFNCVVGQCRQANLDHLAIFEQVKDELQGRLDGPQTPGEFYKLYGYHNDPLERE